MVALINFWDGEEILPYTIENIKPLVDEVIIVYSNYSNYFEFKDNATFLKQFGVSILNYEPLQQYTPADNERRKRNFALRVAKERGHDYFLMLDADEIYQAEPFKKEFERLKNNNLNGLVCITQVYFGSPDLTIGFDTTRVPFIHKLRPETKYIFNREYPFAFDKGIKVDPTRQMNYVKGVEWSDIICHHYSWIRKDYRSKIANSTARMNIEKSDIMNDLLLSKEGYFCKFYRKPLARATVDFGICL